jgi:hypothetical protein
VLDRYTLQLTRPHVHSNHEWAKVITDKSITRPIQGRCVIHSEIEKGLLQSLFFVGVISLAIDMVWFPYYICRFIHLLGSFFLVAALFGCELQILSAGRRTFESLPFSVLVLTAILLDQ